MLKAKFLAQRGNSYTNNQNSTSRITALKRRSQNISKNTNITISSINTDIKRRNIASCSNPNIPSSSNKCNIVQKLNTLSQSERLQNIKISCN